MAFTQQTNQQIAQSLGFTGQAGGGAVDAWLAQNPQLIGQYTAARSQVDPTYRPNTQLQQIQAPPPVQAPVQTQPAQQQATNFAPINQQIASALGFTGTAGGGAVDAWLAQNPQLIPTYTAIRQSVDPSYVPNTQLQQTVQPYLDQIAPDDGGVVPVGQIEPFNQIQRDALQRLGVDLSGQFQTQANQYSDRALQAYDSTTPLINAATRSLTPGDINTGVASYYNPYNEQVINYTNDVIRREGERKQNEIKSGFAGNYGSSALGTRQGLLDESILNAIAGNTANLSSQGFTTALDAFLGRTNQEQDRALNASRNTLAQSALAGDLAGQNYGYKSGNIADQLRAGTAIQQQNQASLDILRPEIYGEQSYQQDQIKRLGELLGLFPDSSASSGSSNNVSNLTKAGGLLTSISGLFG